MRVTTGPTWFFLAMAPAALALLGSGCGSADCSFDGTCVESALDGGLPPIDWPIGCDANGEIQDNPNCIDESIGVFVSDKPTNGAQNGSKQSPFNSLAAAVGALTRQKHRLYVCAGNYNENVVIDADKTAFAAQSEVRIYGRFECNGADWRYLRDLRTVVKVKAGEPALKFAKVDRALVADVEFITEDAGIGQSSIAAFVSTSNVTFRRVGLTAGKGGNGAAPGAAPSNYDEPKAPPGLGPVAAAGGDGGTVLCKNGARSAGGKGGGGVANVEDRNGKKGEANPLSQTTVERDGSGGIGGSSSCGQGAKPGADGAPNAGALGGAQSGTLTAAGWQPAVAPSGNPGNPGQGGGGGGGTTSPAAGGGGGGSGGCGGAGGPGGIAGGSSFALLSFQSRVKLEASALHADVGGKGADGATGENGQGGGSFGAASCNGAFGGNGAGGGGGGGGAGGMSVAIGHIGEAPARDAATIVEAKNGGAPGNGGLGGKAGEGALPAGTNKGNDGKNGEPGQADLVKPL